MRVAPIVVSNKLMNESDQTKLSWIRFFVSSVALRAMEDQKDLQNWLDFVELTFARLTDHVSVVNDRFLVAPKKNSRA